MTKNATELPPRPGDSSSNPVYPPRTPKPSMSGMANTFDRLVDTNLQLVRAIRLALVTLVGLTCTAVAITGFSAWTLRTGNQEMQRAVITILQQCYGKENSR